MSTKNKSSGLKDLVEVSFYFEQERERERQLHMQQALDRRTQVEKLMIEMQVRILNFPSAPQILLHASTSNNTLPADTVTDTRYCACRRMIYCSNRRLLGLNVDKQVYAITPSTH